MNEKVYDLWNANGNIVGKVKTNLPTLKAIVESSNKIVDSSLDEERTAKEMEKMPAHKKCEECGDEMLYCPKCGIYHHEASFTIEHTDRININH